jgi:hypothetical protein
MVRPELTRVERFMVPRSTNRLLTQDKHSNLFDSSISDEDIFKTLTPLYVLQFLFTNTDEK